MDIEKYVQNCQQEIHRLFTLSKAGKEDLLLKSRVEGFVSAWIQLGVFSQVQANDMIENIHLQVFAESVAARKQRKASYAELKLTNPDEYFELPAAVRKGLIRPS